jgi:hypothetical protein
MGTAYDMSRSLPNSCEFDSADERIPLPRLRRTQRDQIARSGNLLHPAELAHSRCRNPQIAELQWRLAMTARRLLGRLALASCAVAVLYVGGCVFNRARMEAAFARVSPGMTERELVELMGMPHEFDYGQKVNSLYASGPCKSPCVRRAWYYNRLQPKGFEAWSFELTDDGHVLDTSYWLSP